MEAIRSIYRLSHDHDVLVGNNECVTSAVGSCIVSRFPDKSYSADENNVYICRLGKPEGTPSARTGLHSPKRAHQGARLSVAFRWHWCTWKDHSIYSLESKLTRLYDVSPRWTLLVKADHFACLPSLEVLGWSPNELKSFSGAVASDSMRHLEPIYCNL